MKTDSFEKITSAIDEKTLDAVLSARGKKLSKLEKDKIKLFEETDQTETLIIEEAEEESRGERIRKGVFKALSVAAAIILIAGIVYVVRIPLYMNGKEPTPAASDTGSVNVSPLTESELTGDGSAPVDTDPADVFPLSGSEPQYDEYAWADADFIKRLSEYQYALNFQTKPWDTNIPWLSQPDPGDYAQVSIAGYGSDPSILIDAISADIEKYNSTYKTSKLFYSIDKYAQCAPGTYKIAIFIAESAADGETVYNYHFYRQDSDGFWSYKLNREAVRHTDSNNVLIVDPEAAAKDNWNADNIVFVGYYAITPWNLMYNDEQTTADMNTLLNNLSAELFPVSGSEPLYDESVWAGTDFSEYQYILNCQTKPFDTKCPGDFAHVSIEGYENDPSILIEAISADVKEYNSKYNTSKLFYSIDKYAQCDPGTYKIAIYITETTVYGETVYNYHFFRQDSDGFWSHKPYNGDVSHTNSDNWPILEPDTAFNKLNADRMILVGYYAISPWNHMLY